MRSLLALLIALDIAGAADDKFRLVRETDALTPQDEQTKLHAPPGFSVQLFASEPMINKPINMAFDARGRLWVSSTVEYPYAAAKERWADAQGSRVKDSRDAIKILEDTDGDGTADKVTDFADGLNIPTGVLPWHKPEHKNGCIAWSIPNIWYFADTDGDGKCDKRELLFGPLGYEKDTHGMCSSFRLGLDGWVYATHGFNNTSHLKAKDGSTLDLHSGNVFRFRPDGSRVELYSAGQVNPFGLCWDRYNNLYSADCHSNPITQLIRGACYPSFGKPHDGLGFGPVMCEHSHGSTGLCGIIYIDGGVWGPEWDDHMFLGNCVTSKVNHDKITFTGSTPKANEQPDFITSDDPWFRPVDLQLGPDNALYIADFYNKIIGHYEMPLDHKGRDKTRGRIWRISKKTGGTKRQPNTPTDISDWRKALQSTSPHTQRAILASLLDAPKLEALPILLQNTAKTPSSDPSLVLAYRIALRDHLKLPGGFTNIGKTDLALVTDISTAVPTTDAASFLLQRLQTGNSITPAILTHIARYSDPALLPQVTALAKQASLHHSTTPLAPLPLLTALHDGLSERGEPPPPELLSWAQDLAKQLLDDLSRQPAQAWTSTGNAQWSLQPRKLAEGGEVTVLQSMAKGGGDEESRTGTLKSKTFDAPAKLTVWLNGHRGFPTAKPHDKNLLRIVEAENDRELARAFPPRDDKPKRTEIDLSAHTGKRVRIEVTDGDDGKAYAWLGLTRIEPAVLGVEDFDAEQQQTAALRKLALMLRTTAPVSLRDQLAPYLPKPPKIEAPKPRPELDALIAARTAAFAKAKPDAAKGALVFQASCAVCHQIKGRGGLIGPQLDGIGTRGVERLCEDILDPNRNVDAHFHIRALTLKDGSALVGFLRAEAGQVLILADAAGQEHRISKTDIAKDTTTPVSLMPPTFAQTLDEQAFHDLLGYLLAEKAAE